MTRIEVRLGKEGVVIEGALLAVDGGTAAAPRRLWMPRWTCPCGAEIDTAAMPRDALYDVTGGYCLHCPGCGRWYMHHIASGYVAG